MLSLMFTKIHNFDTNRFCIEKYALCFNLLINFLLLVLKNKLTRNTIKIDNPLFQQKQICEIYFLINIYFLPYYYTRVIYVFDTTFILYDLTIAN